jgi:hypothetical protein
MYVFSNGVFVYLHFCFVVLFFWGKGCFIFLLSQPKVYRSDVLIFVNGW